jgi:hypothetical protein
MRDNGDHMHSTPLNKNPTPDPERQSPDHSADVAPSVDAASSSEPPQSAVGGKASWRAQLERLTRAVADADAAEVEAAVRQLGESRRYLTPIGWAAGACVLLIRGITLLIRNWRLSLIELVPAAWVWIVMWNLKRHALRGAPFREITLGGTVLLAVLTVGITLIAIWCNTVFAFAVDTDPPKVGPAARRTRSDLPMIAGAALVIGLLLTFAAVVVPRIGPTWLYVITLGGVLALMLINFVAVPARIIGLRRQRQPPRQAVGSWLAGGALSAVAMGPGFLLDRIGLILLGVSGLQVLGFVLLSIGTALYAAGMSSVRAVKLSMKLNQPE